MQGTTITCSSAVSHLRRGCKISSLETNARAMRANSYLMQHQRHLSSASLSSRVNSAGRRSIVIGCYPTGAVTEASAFGTGRTQYRLPHLATSCLPTNSVRAFTSNSTSFFKSPQYKQISLNPFGKKMSLQKETLSPGDGKTYPQPGQTVTMEYTGWLHEAGADKNRGKQFDSSVGRGDFKTKIGVGQVIQGWDKGVPQMSLGERAVLTIPGEMAYGSRGFPGLIPPMATLIFEVQLKKIEG